MPIRLSEIARSPGILEALRQVAKRTMPRLRLWKKLEPSIDNVAVHGRALYTPNFVSPDESWNGYSNSTPIRFGTTSMSFGSCMDINNTQCKFFDGNPHLRCAVNPTGKCDGCNDFVARGREGEVYGATMLYVIEPFTPAAGETFEIRFDVEP